MTAISFAAKLSVLGVILAGIAVGQTQLNLTAPVPAPPTPGGFVNGQSGSSVIYYWVVARYPIGVVQSAVTPVSNTVDIPNLNGTNFVTVQWPGLASATGYDVVRSNTPLFPATCSSCAVATNTTATSVNDTGGGSAYSLPTPAATPATGILNLNNIAEPAPYLQLNLNGLQYRIMPFSGTYTIGDVPMFAANGVLVDSGGTGGGGGGGVPVGRRINTTPPLAGGGTLAADLTLTCGLASSGVTGCLSGTDWTTFNNKQAAGSYITGLTGDVSASGPGNVGATLATVNGSPGACTADNAHTCQFTSDAKGRITTQSSVAILGGNAVLRNQANTYSGGGLQDLSLVDLLLPIHASDPATCTPGQIEFNSTGTVLKICTASNSWQTSAPGSVTVSVGGASIGTQPGINYISGNGLTWACTNNPGSSRIDCTPVVNFAVAESIATSQAGKDTFCNSTTGTTSYTCTLIASAALTAPYVKGMLVDLVTDTSCPAACSLNIDTVGVVNIKQIDGATNPTGQITAGQPTLLYYDGTFFRILTAGGSGGSGVTSVSFTGGLISVATATSTPAFTVAGTSGGIPFFSSASTWASSAALTVNLPVIGGGAGVAPTVGTVTGNTTEFPTWTGATTAARCVHTDGSGNLVIAAADCSTGGLSPPASLANSYLSQTYVVGSGGVTANLTVRLDASNPSQVILATSADIGVILGIAATTQSAGANVEVILYGQGTCVADGSISAGHLLIAGTGTGGRCKDAGTVNIESVTQTQQVLGRALATTTVGNTLALQMYGPGLMGTGLGGTIGTLLATNGGTGLASPAAHSLMVTEGASAFTLLAAATGGRLLLDQGAGVDPAYQVLGGDGTITAGGVLTLTQINGSNFTVSAAGLLTKVDGITTAGKGFGIEGWQTVLSNSSATALVTLATAPGAGDYEVHYDLDLHTPCTTGTGALNLTFAWTGNASRTTTTGNWSLPSAQAASSSFSGIQQIHVVSGNVTFTPALAVACSTGTATWDGLIWLTVN